MRQRATAQTSVANRGRTSFSPQIAAMYAAGLKGIWRESGRAGTLFVENTGLTLVSPGSMAGLVLSLDQGGGRGVELVPMPLDLASGAWLNVGTVSASTANSFTNTSGAGAGKTAAVLTVGKTYEIVVDFTKSDATTGFLIQAGVGNAANVSTTAGSGVLRSVTTATAATLYLRLAGNATLTVNSISAKEVPGNHQSQATTQSRPLYQVGPPRPVFDGVDDVLNTTFASALGANCTVGRFIAGTGAVITTGVNIGTTYADSVTSGPLLIGDRALTAAETQLWTAYLNQQGNL